LKAAGGVFGTVNLSQLMRAITSVFCIAIAAAPALRAQTSKLPPVVRAGLEVYKVSGSAAAVTRWLKGSPVTDVSGNAAKGFEQIETAYGRMVGYEVLDVVPFGTYASRTYLVILYEKGPAFAWFDCYLPKDEWIVTGFLFNAKPDPILPPKMLTH
jgi:hypothetical protein